MTKTIVITTTEEAEVMLKILEHERELAHGCTDCWCDECDGPWEPEKE